MELVFESGWNVRDVVAAAPRRPDDGSQAYQQGNALHGLRLHKNKQLMPFNMTGKPAGANF
jgi:hypothetical protein